MLNQLLRALSHSKLTQAQIAAKAGISQAAVSRIIDGKRAPSLEVAERLAKAVGKRLVLK